MQSRIMTTGHSMRILRLGILLLCLGALAGCYQYVEFRPSKGEEPITLFGRYRANINDRSEGRRFYCEFSFVQAKVDTANLDMLPILVLDSVCFRGVCLNKDIRLCPTSWYDEDQISVRRGHGHTYWADQLIRDRDLYYIGGQVVPGGFHLWGVFRLPEACDRDDVTVELRARLLDRLTGEEIARESRVIPFRIKRGGRLGMS